jgi:RNA polymerase sigma factor (sigma-70 family)
MTLVDDNLAEALRSLDPRSRRIVEMRVAGSGLEEIAMKLRLPPRQVRMTLARALRRIRGRLKARARRELDKKRV